jgi:inner membrane protein
VKWHSHKLTTIAMVYAATGTLVSAALAGIGSVLPDVFEFKVIPHRTVTHWPYSYIVLCVILYAFVCVTPTYPVYFLFFILLGCVCHLFEDCLSRGGIPWKTPNGPRKGFDFYVTHTANEYLTVWVLVFVSLTAMFARGFLHKDYLTEEVQHAYRFLNGFLKSMN